MPPIQHLLGNASSDGVMEMHHLIGAGGIKLVGIDHQLVQLHYCRVYAVKDTIDFMHLETRARLEELDLNLSWSTQC